VASWEPPAPPVEPSVFTVDEPRSAWPEPEVIPPAFDPAASVPPAATPVETAGNGVSTPFADPAALPRRAPGGTPLGADPGRSSGSPSGSQALPQRTPGSNLSHEPVSQAPTPGQYDARPRPERVHDLLTRHLRGIRDGREDGVAGVVEDPIDAEDRP
jgi:hypothetical protein